MIRKTLTIFSLIGLLLTVGLWVASFWDSLAFRYDGKPPTFGVFQGGFMLAWGEGANLPVRKPSTFRFHPTLWLPRCGLSNGTLVYFLPLWIPTLCFAVMLYFCRPLTFHRRRKRKKLGLCLNCGYDLRGSKDRCPECGQEFVS